MPNDLPHPIWPVRSVRKSHYSGFCNTSPATHLRERGIRYLLLTGIAANVCVESTGHDACFAEFWPILVEDAIKPFRAGLQPPGDPLGFRERLRLVTSTDKIIEALASAGT